MRQCRAAQFLLTAAAFNAAVALAQPATPSAVPETDVPQLRDTLNDGSTKAEMREQAAQRLLSRPDPAARTAVVDALGGSPAVQLAATRALATHPTSDPKFVQPLLKLLDPSSPEVLLDAVGRALSAFKNDPAVPARLLNLATGGDDKVRLVAIRTLGTFVDQDIAASLVKLTDPGKQPARIIAAANESLAYLTGLPTSTDWPAWWDQNKGKAPAQFAADLAPQRSMRFDVVDQNLDDLQDEFSRLLADLYQRTPRDQQAELLVRHMRSPNASVRAAACRLATQAAANDVVPLSVKEQLRQLIGDASPDVRRASAQALEILNDPDAVVPLLVQLNQETDARVRAALAAALRPTRDERSIPALVALLDDSDPKTVQTAAEALAEVAGGLRQSDANKADQIAVRLMSAVNTRTKPQSNVELRAALISAVGPMQSPAVVRDLLRLLSSPAEDKLVRRALLVAAGRYGSDQFTSAITDWTGDQDAQIRIASIRALGQSAANFGSVQAVLATRIDPKNESQADVRDAAWAVLTKLLPTASAEQLGFWETTRLKNEPAKRMAVLREQRDRAAKAGRMEEVAQRDQQIGRAALDSNQFAEAIKSLQAALGYSMSNNKEYLTDVASADLVDAYLKNREYAKAVDTVQKMIALNPMYQERIGSKLPREADQLVQYKRLEEAAQLIEMSLKMKPELARQYKDTLQSLREQVNARNNQRNENPGRPAGTVETTFADSMPGMNAF